MRGVGFVAKIFVIGSARMRGKEGGVQLAVNLGKEWGRRKWAPPSKR